MADRNSTKVLQLGEQTLFEIATRIMIERNPPIVEQVVTILNSRIRSGQYAAGCKLPSEHELAKEFQVSRPSIREALSELEAKGLLWRRQGAGTFVVEGKNIFRLQHPSFFSLMKYIEEAGFEASMMASPPQFRPITLEEKTRLRNPQETIMVVLFRDYCADKTPVFICEYHIPEYILNAPLDAIDFSLDIPDFCQKFAKDQVGAIQSRVIPVLPNADIAAKMGVDFHDPLIKMQDVFYGKHGVPIFLNSLYYNCKKMDFSVFFTIA
jgi:DNA-binding GntR family transcriptional regulator